MADINQQTEELARIMEQVNREMAMYGQITKTTADQKRDAEIQAATGLSNFTKASGTAADAVGHLATAGMAAGKAMLEGKKGAAAFNESIDGLTKAATAAGVALTLLIPGGAIIKGIVAGLTAVTAATAGMVKASNEMADKLYKGYSGLAKSGAAASDGMTGVFNDAKKLGLSMNELDSFVGQVGENAGDLALFAGSVFEGRKKFADMGEAMEPYRKQMIAAGFTQEQINESTMGYIRLQTRMGAAQNKTTVELAQGAKKYLEEQDALTKLTGQTRKEMEDQNARALQQQQFAAKIRELEMTGQQEAADELMKLNTMYGAMGPKTQAAFQASVTGNLANADALDINIQSQAEMLRTSSMVASGQMKAAEAAQTTGKAIGRFNDEVNISLAGMNAGIGSFAEGEKARQLTAGAGIVENMKKIEEQQRLQGLKGGKNADAITQQYAETIKKQQELNEKFERTVFKGIDNALAITNRLANATDVLATGFEKLGTVVNRLLNIIGLGVKEPTEAPKPTTVREAEAVAVTNEQRNLAAPLQERVNVLAKQLDADEKTLKDAKRSGKFGDELKPLEEKIAKAKEEYAKAAQDLTEQEKKIAAAAREERKVRLQQKLDQSELARLENMNLVEVERLAKLNEEKANLAAKGVDTAKADKKINEIKASIENRSGKISAIKQRLTPPASSPTPVPAPAVQTDASGRATAASDTRSATAAPPTPASPAGETTARSMARPTGSPPPPSAGAPDGQPGQAAPAGQEQGGGKGSLRIGPNADMSGIDSEMISRLEKFAQVSGKPVDITSAFRSDKKQAELWVRGHILKEPGIHMPAAPKDDQEVNYKGKTYQVKGSGIGSLHGVGNAVDIAGMVKKRGPVDDLMANVGLFRPFIIDDHPHVQMLAEGGIVQPTPGGTPAIIGEGGNAEAVIPLKGNRVPVDFPDEIKRFFQFQSQVDNLKFLKGNNDKSTYEDVDAVVAASQVKMFAKLESMKMDLMTKGWDREILENYGEEAKPSGPKTEADVGDLQSRFNDDVVAESIKENVEQTRTLIDMISELVREQRNANDISTRILQVSSN